MNNVQVPDWILIRVANKAVHYGNEIILRLSYEYLQKEIPESKSIACANNAIKHGYPRIAAVIYKKLGKKIPMKAYLAAANEYLKAEKMSPQTAFCAYDEISKPIPKELLQEALNICKANHWTRGYYELCSLLGIPMDKTFLKECLEHYVKELECGAIRYVADMLKKSFSPKKRLNLGIRALTKEKYKEAREFFAWAEEKR